MRPPRSPRCDVGPGRAAAPVSHGPSPDRPLELPADWASRETSPGAGWRDGPGFAVGFDRTPANPGGTNLARTGTVSQSTVGYGLGPDQAIDGDPTTFTHTASDDDASSWSVDLGAAYELSRVVIRNRVGCCASRLRDITVTLLAADGIRVVWSSRSIRN